jgi:hypothetical protein
VSLLFLLLFGRLGARTGFGSLFLRVWIHANFFNRLGAFRGERNAGVYLMDCQVSDEANSRAVSSEGAERLWGLSEGLVGEKFVW